MNDEIKCLTLDELEDVTGGKVLPRWLANLSFGERLANAPRYGMEAAGRGAGTGAFNLTQEP